MPIIFIIFISIITFIWPAFARAESFSLGVYPPIVQIEAKPPANISTPLLIENLSPEPVELNIELKPFIASDQENGQIKYLESIPQEYSSIFQRVAVLDGTRQINQLALGPKQKKELTVNINVPRDVQSSDYYFSIVFLSDTSDTSDNSNASKISGGIAINVLLAVGGERTAEGTVLEFSAPIFIEKGPVPFTIRVKNTGNHYIAPKGEVIIKNLLGQTVGKVDLLPVNILAGSVRAIPSELETGGESLWKESFILGPYRAILNLSLSDTGPQISREIIFFAFPGLSILTILGGLIILLYLSSRVKRKI